jgi:hypothetical protein
MGLSQHSGKIVKLRTAFVFGSNTGKVIHVLGFALVGILGWS